jgi:ethanolamine utilization protein EutN
MKLGKVTGNVVSTKKLDWFIGERFLLVQPIDENGKEHGSKLVATDVAQAGPGDIIIYEEGREAANALKDAFNISDATILGVVDSINIG